MVGLKTNLWRKLPTALSRRTFTSSCQEEISQTFQGARVGGFRQEGPRHEHAWRSDSVLRAFLGRAMPKQVLEVVEPDLDRFGERVATEVWPLGQECEANPPWLEQTDAWGHRVDRLVTCDAWKRMKSISAEEGLVAIPYSGEYAEYGRLYQVAKLYMFAPASGLFSCPLAMTDGAAATLQLLGVEGNALKQLTSRDPKTFWTSGQWMTEPRGGSDVNGSTETVAVADKEDGRWKLHGYKWFSSATDSDMALTLARVVRGGKVGGLSMFYLKTRREDGQLNGIQVAKLKNKLGTRQLPTAELLLDGTEAVMVGEEGRGIANISSMLTVTRLHNTTAAVGSMRKVTSLARDYATRRQAFGKRLAEHPLHMQTLARMEVETRGCLVLLLELARLQGRVEQGVASDEDALLLRLFTPVAKFYTAKAAVATISEGLLECFGGQGYIEDTGLPGMLRDAQVLPIWEGTSSVMALDVLRALGKSRYAALHALQHRLAAILAKGKHVPTLASPVNHLTSALASFQSLNLNELPQAGARDLSLSLAQIYIGGLLVEHALARAGGENALPTAGGGEEKALATKRGEDAWAAAHWCSRGELVPVVGRVQRGEYADRMVQDQGNMVYSGYSQRETF